MTQWFTDWLLFRRMTAPTLVTILFVLGSGLSVTLGLVKIVGGVSLIIADHGQAGLVVIALGLLTMTAGPALLRLLCEVFVVPFKIAEELVALRDIAGRQEAQDVRPRMQSSSSRKVDAGTIRHRDRVVVPQLHSGETRDW